MPPSSTPREQHGRRRRSGAATVTLRDVAGAAHVAESTVSRALAGDPRISPATRRAVERIARRLGYAPNALARGLAGRGADVIAVVVPRGAEFTFSSPFHLALLEGISRVLQEAGQLLLLSFLEERDYVALHRSGLCRGVIVLMCRIGDPQVAALARHRVPTVLVPGDPSLPRVASVTFDIAGPTAAATRHLLELGHRRIGFIGGAPTSLFHRDRLSAFHRALATAGVRADPRLEAETNFTPEEGYRRALELLALPERPTAILCSGDLVAQGVLGAAHKLGLRIPADLSLVSLSGLPGPRVGAPALAAVISDFAQAGATAATILLELITEHRAPATPVLMPAEFDPGESTAGPGG
jgi:DNA-binding LacI/PurR family transcriptional regulator